MKPTRQIHDPYHNPFHNRFHVPVHSRLDEMQAYTHMVWLNEPAALDHETEQKPARATLGTRARRRLRAGAGRGIFRDVTVELKHSLECGKTCQPLWIFCGLVADSG